MRPMNCREAENWMDRLLDEAGLDHASTRSAALDRHLSGCAACRRQWEILTLAESALRIPQPVAAPASSLSDFRTRLAIENQRSVAGQPKWPVWLRLGAPMGGLAAALAVTVIVIMQPSRPPRPAGLPDPARSATGLPVVPTPPDSGARDAAPERAPTVLPRTRLRSAAGGVPGVQAAPNRRPSSAASRPVRLARGPAGLTAAAWPEGLARRAADEMPPEFGVSPALLTALRRNVVLRGAQVTLGMFVDELSQVADVPVQLDASLDNVTVVLNETEQPLWKAIQGMAQQASLEVVPQENSLVLRPVSVETPMVKGSRGLADKQGGGSLELNPRGQAQSLGLATTPGGLGGGAPAPPFAGGGGGGFGPGSPPAGPRAGLPQAPGGGSRRAGAAQGKVGMQGEVDRRVWPACWGVLPEREFEPPSRDEVASGRMTVPAEPPDGLERRAAPNPAAKAGRPQPTTPGPQRR